MFDKTQYLHLSLTTLRLCLRRYATAEPKPFLPAWTFCLHARQKAAASLSAVNR